MRKKTMRLRRVRSQKTSVNIITTALGDSWPELAEVQRSSCAVRFGNQWDYREAKAHDFYGFVF